LLNIGGCFSLSRFADKPLALNAGRYALRLSSQALRLLLQPLI
jgi:hypothetical protein